MLSRATQVSLRRDARQNLQACIEKIQLPWLYPALFRVSQQSRKAPAIAQSPLTSGRRPVPPTGRRRTSVNKLPPHRGLAFAAAEAHDIPKDDYVPFEGTYSSSEAPIDLPSPWPTANSVSVLKDFDPSSPLIINDVLATNLKVRGFRGIGGLLTEIQQTLHACLKVGCLERAAATVRRLNKLCEKHDPELLKSHNDYLQGMVEKVVTTKEQTTLKQLQKWFEVDIRAAGIHPDATTYALMIKAAFQEANVLKTDRTIRRYIDMARKDGVCNEAISLPILSDQEFGKVTQVRISQPIFGGD